MTHDAVPCASCGAQLLAGAAPGEVVACSYCGASFRVAASKTPEPDLGDLLLAADLAADPPPGFARTSEMAFERGRGTPLELFARETRADNMTRGVIWTPGHFADFDLGATLRVVEGCEDTSAGFRLRQGDAGGYMVRISVRGTFSVSFQQPGYGWGGWISNWAEHNALRTGLGVANRLRVVAAGDTLRVYLNGVLATSLHDDRFRAGSAQLVLNALNAPALLAVSELTLREPPRR